MNIIVSACLLGENCKYNGGNNRHERVLEFVKGHRVIPVCPEMLGGLPIPRQPAEILHGIVVDADSVSVDEQFRRGASLALLLAKENEVDLAILQPRSPSCGSRQIYDGTFSKRLVPGKGVFAQLLSDNGIEMVEPDELENLFR